MIEHSFRSCFFFLLLPYRDVVSLDCLRENELEMQIRLLLVGRETQVDLGLHLSAHHGQVTKASLKQLNIN